MNNINNLEKSRTTLSFYFADIEDARINDVVDAISQIENGGILWHCQVLAPIADAYSIISTHELYWVRISFRLKYFVR